MAEATSNSVKNQDRSLSNYRLTIFTWLNAAAAITLVSKIGVATIQSQPPFDMENDFKRLFPQSIVGTPKCSD